MKNPKVSFTLLVMILCLDSVAHGQRKVEVLIRDISIFNPHTGRMIPHRDIVVSDTRIVDVLPAGKNTGSAKTVINESGKYAIPGLFDNHVHMARLTEVTAGLFLARRMDQRRFDVWWN